MTIKEIRAITSKVAKKRNVKRVSLFGSYLSEPKVANDIDLLVDFGQRPVSLFTVSGFKADMEYHIGKKVDVIPLPLPPKSFLEINKEVLLYVSG